MSKILVFGASGQLGQCLQHIAAKRNISYIYFIPREKANILDLVTLQLIFNEYKPAYCINCAAYTAVDKAEDEKDIAMNINRDGVMNLSRLCSEFNTTLIHISTDFVFSGSSNLPLSESDEPSPVNVYGLSKLEGEKAIPLYIDHYFIIRTSWLYSAYGNNFVKTMLRLGKEKNELKVIWDQIGTPTYAMDLALCILAITENNNTQYGIYHYSNEGVTSWYDFAKTIFDLSHTSVKVIPVRTAEYITKAQRPAYSVMDKTKIKRNLAIEIPYWKQSLENCIKLL
jgi:dTDP-4-dehydrorhamnose reductase